MTEAEQNAEHAMWKATLDFGNKFVEMIDKSKIKIINDSKANLGLAYDLIAKDSEFSAYWEHFPDGHRVIIPDFDALLNSKSKNKESC